MHFFILFWCQSVSKVLKFIFFYLFLCLSLHNVASLGKLLYIYIVLII